MRGYVLSERKGERTSIHLYLSKRLLLSGYSFWKKDHELSRLPHRQENRLQTIMYHDHRWVDGSCRTILQKPSHDHLWKLLQPYSTARKTRGSCFDHQWGLQSLETSVIFWVFLLECWVSAHVFKFC